MLSDRDVPVHSCAMFIVPKLREMVDDAMHAPVHAAPYTPLPHSRGSTHEGCHHNGRRLLVGLAAHNFFGSVLCASKSASVVVSWLHAES